MRYHFRLTRMAVIKKLECFYSGDVKQCSQYGQKYGESSRNKNEFTVRSGNHISGYISERIEIWISDEHSSVHYSTIHNSQDVQEISTDEYQVAFNPLLIQTLLQWINFIHPWTDEWIKEMWGTGYIYIYKYICIYIYVCVYIWWNVIPYIYIYNGILYIPVYILECYLALKKERILLHG